MEALHRQVLGARDLRASLRIGAEVRDLVLNTPWSDIFERLSEFAALIADFVSVTGNLCPEDVLSVLEALIRRYSRELSSTELTLAHGFLATHCRHHNRFSSEIRNFAEISAVFFLEQSAVGDYFMNAAKIMNLHADLANEAAIAAALAVTVKPNLRFYQHWCLHELVAYGSVTPLPVTVKNTLVDDFAQLFSRKTVDGWHAVVNYANEYQLELNEAGLGVLVRSALAKLGVQVLRTSLELVSRQPVSDLVSVLLETVSLDELERAGLSEVGEIREGAVYRVCNVKADSAKLLAETSWCCQIMRK